MTREQQVEEVREKITEYLVDFTEAYKNCTKGCISKEELRAAINTFLFNVINHPRIAILDEEQQLPDSISNLYLGNLTVMGTEDMEANFRRIIPKEVYHGNSSFE